MATESITLSIEGNDVPAEKLIAVIREFYALLDEVAYEVCGKKRARWVARVKEGSNQVVFSPSKGEQAPMEHISGALFEGLACLEKNTESEPPYYNMRAIGHAHNLGRAFHAKRDPGSSVQVISGGRHLTISDGVSAGAWKYIAAEHEEMGSVEGRLEVISGHKGFSYKIYDDLTDRAVECESLPEKEKAIKETVLGTFEKRVSAYGLIKFNAAGQPLRIIVHELRVFKDDSELPTVEDMQRLFAR